MPTLDQARTLVCEHSPNTLIIENFYTQENSTQKQKPYLNCLQYKTIEFMHILINERCK